MSFCNKCGSNINPNENFCPKCGNNLAVNEFITAPYQEIDPIINTNTIPDSMQSNIESKNDRTRFWLIMKLVVLAVFIALLFLPGTIFCSYTEYDHTYEYERFYGHESPLSFVEYSNHDLYSAYGSTSPSDFQTVMLILIAAFLILEIVFSFIRIVKFKFIKINFWQLILPILIFLLFITSCVSFYFDSYHENERFTYEFTYTDPFDGEIEQYEDTFTQKQLDAGYATPENTSSSDTTYKLIYSIIYSYSLGPVFYIAIAVFIIMLAIDCYTIKKVKLLQKSLQ